MKARLRNVFSHSAPRWEPSDIRSEDPGQRSNSDARHTPTNTKDKPNKRITFHIKSLSSTTFATPNQNTQLLKPRKSAISLTSIPDSELDARTNFQWQSTFFAQLPLEIRRMVYGYLFEGETIHLMVGDKKDKLGRKETKFGNFICTQEHIGQCTCRVVVARSPLETSLPQLEIGHLSLVRSCRRMYSECIYYLYAHHTFSLLHATHLLALPKHIPEQRLNTIQHLRLRWQIRALPYLRRGNSSKYAYREDTENWERGWEILASMKGLKTLSVMLVDPSQHGIWENNWLELEGVILEPVKKARVAEFEVVLPYASCDTERDMGSCGVRLRRPDEGEEQP
ncbi:hypothetical protein BU25DRAFT_34285 [Macroventuria anomochaeta]|uniref:Uncharacterized protein n=1 Tax=Macroventuria anomochaeta TaxID=301207 RepID=A0ACB6S4T9_9PLEO|nr:uncharacterized protein BU25DRAFT_34285 [Macroventuria anomochaeta]KAF2628373.1 hypothetical protein BU25DRAFT_34285 [Macroventuria anomochaeta]